MKKFDGTPVAYIKYFKYFLIKEKAVKLQSSLCNFVVFVENFI